ncbi:MAG: hypothetical protein AAFX06_21325 [Planctomycetota bacterium]
MSKSKQAEEPKCVEFPADHPMRAIGFVREGEAKEFFGVASWSTWRQNYRMKIAGLTVQTQSVDKNERIYHESDLLDFYHRNKTGGPGGSDQSPDS